MDGTGKYTRSRKTNTSHSLPYGEELERAYKEGKETLMDGESGTHVIKKVEGKSGSGQAGFQMMEKFKQGWGDGEEQGGGE